MKSIQSRIEYLERHRIGDDELVDFPGAPPTMTKREFAELLAEVQRRGSRLPIRLYPHNMAVTE